MSQHANGSLPKRLAVVLHLAFVAATLGSCANRKPSTVASTESPSDNSPATFALRTVPGDECPLAGAVPVTFRIDASASEPVQAIQDDGQPLRVLWPPGFTAGSSADPVVRDPSGLVV